MVDGQSALDGMRRDIGEPVAAELAQITCADNAGRGPSLRDVASRGAYRPQALGRAQAKVVYVAIGVALVAAVLHGIIFRAIWSGVSESGDAEGWQAFAIDLLGWPSPSAQPIVSATGGCVLVLLALATAGFRAAAVWHMAVAVGALSAVVIASLPTLVFCVVMLGLVALFLLAIVIVAGIAMAAIDW